MDFSSSEGEELLLQKVSLKVAVVFSNIYSRYNFTHKKMQRMQLHIQGMMYLENSPIQMKLKSSGLIRNLTPKNVSKFRRQMHSTELDQHITAFLQEYLHAPRSHSAPCLILDFESKKRLLKP